MNRRDLITLATLASGISAVSPVWAQFNFGKALEAGQDLLKAESITDEELRAKMIEFLGQANKLPAQVSGGRADVLGWQLPAGSVATAGRNGVLVRSLPVAEAERYLEWRDGFLTFDDTSLAEAAAEFNRFNTRKLELGDAAVADLRVGGNFRWSNAEGFAHLLEQGFPVRAERRADRIVLYSR